MRKHNSLFTTLILIVLSLAACTSRYRLDLYMVREGERKKVGVEESEFLMDVVIGNPYTRDNKLVAGDGNCLIISTGTRGATQTAGQSDVLSWDRYLRFEIYMQLPLGKPSGRIPLKDNSFLNLLGHFERPVDETVYMPESGDLLIDSATDSHLFGTLNGEFANSAGERIGFEGQFKAKHRY